MSDEDSITDDNIDKKIQDLDDNYDARLQELKEELSDCFEIDSNRLEDENMKTVSRLHLWLTRLAEENLLLKKMQRKKQLTYTTLYELVRTGKNGHIALTDKGIDYQIQKMSTYRHMASMVDQQEVITEYISNICWALKQTKMSALKNISDSKRMELG